MAAVRRQRLATAAWSYQRTVATLALGDWVNAIVGAAADPGRPGRAPGRRCARELRDGRAMKAVVRAGARRRLDHAYTGRRGCRYRFARYVSSVAHPTWRAVQACLREGASSHSLDP